MEAVSKCLALAFTVICLCLQCVWGCDGSNPKYGNMTKDQQLEVGSTLTIRCTLFTNVILSNGTDFYVTSQNLMIKFKNSYLEDLEIIDSHTLQYTKDNATINDTGLYSCFISIPTISYNPFICVTEVSVGFKPLPVKNFSCVSIHFQILNCSWENPFNPIKTKYELYDILAANFRRKCAHLNDSYCFWTLASSPPYRKSSKRLEFKLVGKNNLGEREDSIRVNHFEIVKPDHPRRLTFTNLTKTSVRVQWFRPKGMEYDDFPPGLDYWLYYCPSSGKYPELCGVVNTTRETSYVLTSLVPFIEYKVNIRCRSTVASSEDMWSEFENATFQTKPDEPHLAPETISSSFEVQNVGHVRDIILYWKPIPSKFEYGSNFHYVIHYHTHYRRPRYKRETVVKNVGNVTSHTFRLDVETTYLFRIFAVNSVGISKNSSVIVVDKGMNMLKGPSDIAVLSYGHGKYTVSWKSQQIAATNTTYFTLFWCRDIRPRPFKCAGPIEWLITENKFHELTLSDNSTNYQFAIASNEDGYTSGITWASCIVPYGGVLYGVNDMLLTPKNATSIRIRWVLDCTAQKSVIQQYLISYCAVAFNGSCFGNKASILLNNSDVDQYIIGGLRPFTRYKFGVQARTADGWSEDSYFRYETTLSAAPGGSPRNVRTVVNGDTLIKVTFQPPLIPNGIITRYVILYGKASGTSEKHRLNFPVLKSAEFYEAEINKSIIFFYTNYSIEVEACVDLLCSLPSKPVFIRTGIGLPGLIDPPHTQIINASMVNITWKPPNIPNGPIDAYLVTMVWQEETNADEKIHREIFNVSENFLTVSVACPEELYDGMIYYFSIQAVNIKNGSLLISSHSDHSQARLCYVGPNGISPAVLAGLIAGIACGLIVLVISIYALAKWMKKKVDMVKSITVQLPPGLDSPIENPLNSYDKFKNGLQKNRDSGIPSEHTYERLCSYASDKSSKEFENFYEASSEEFLNSKTGREKSGRNQSGDSSASGKCHDSISSSNTNKTHLSIDSGAEMDLPQSPDGLFSDTSSSNTTPRSYKPDLEIVEESNVSSSKDSGLEKEGLGQSSLNMKTTTDITNGFPYYIRKKNQPYFNVQMLKKNGQIQPYSKFAVIAPAFAPRYVTYGVHNLNLLNQQSLANSEPSVADAQEEDDDSEPLMLSGVPPYCKFGLARSAGNGINIMNQSIPVQPNLGYSKFGIIYSTMGKQDNGNTLTLNQSCIPTYTKIGCPKVIQNPLVQKLFLNAPVAMKPIPDAVMSKQTDDKSHFTIPTPEKKQASKGYVSFNQALSSPGPNCSNSKITQDLTMTNIISIPESPDEKSSDEADDTIDSIVTDVEDHVSQENQPQRQVNSYVSFQDAKVMSMHDPLSTDSHNSVFGGTEPSLCDIHSGTPIRKPIVADVAANIPTDNACEIIPPVCLTDLDPTQIPFINAHEVVKPCVPQEINSSKADELGDKLLHENTVQNLTLESTPNGDCSPCHAASDSKISSHDSERTILEDVSVEPNKPKSNGYVPWAELLDKPSNFASIITFPNGTSSTDVANV